MKIIIVGAGISGMINYLYLRKLLPESLAADISLLEAYHEPVRKGRDISATTNATNSTPIGGGLGINPNGLRAFKNLDIEIYNAIRRCGYPVLRYEMRSARGHLLGAANASFEGVPTQMILRQDVWETLRGYVPDEAIRFNSRVSDVRSSADGRVEIQLTDGSIETADILIGADGLNSKVRPFVVGYACPAHYEGFVGVGGSHPSSALKPLPPGNIVKAPNSPCVMTFGPEGMVGYTPGSQSLGDIDNIASTNTDDYVPSYGSDAFWWSSYEIAANANTDPQSFKLDLEAIRAQLVARHGKWNDEHLVEFITSGKIVGLWPVFTVPKVPSYHRGRAVLTGDAAHCMPPSAGQGVSQALEDGHALALFLAHYLPQTCDQAQSSTLSMDEALDKAFAKFTNMRKPRNDKILDIARKMGDHKRKKGFVEEWITYGAIWAFTRMSSAKRDQEFFGYDVEKAVNEMIASG